MAVFEIDVGGVSESDTALRKFGAGISSWAPFWRLLGKSLADEAQARWPLRRRSGRLRESLAWSGNKLGRGGIFETSPDRLQFGTQIFYSRFAQFGAKRQRKTPLIHVNPDEHTEQLRIWLKARAVASGLEIT